MDRNIDADSHFCFRSNGSPLLGSACLFVSPSPSFVIPGWAFTVPLAIGHHSSPNSPAINAKNLTIRFTFLFFIAFRGYYLHDRTILRWSVYASTWNMHYSVGYTSWLFSQLLFFRHSPQSVQYNRGHSKFFRSISVCSSKEPVLSYLNTLLVT